MTRLDVILPLPRLCEIDHVELAVSPDRAWTEARHLDLGRSAIVRALFSVRTIPSRLGGHRREAPRLGIDDLDASSEPGFHVLAETPGEEVVVGAIGKVWKPDIPFVDVRTADAYRAFVEPGYVKVAWALRVIPRGDRDARLEIEVRVDATDDASWARFRRYFRLVGPASRFIRRHLLAELMHELGAPESRENEKPLTGDELLPDARAQMTHGITIAAPPEAIWPWLVQMGRNRGGWYSYDLLDDGGLPSARELHPELQTLRVGDVLPVAPEGDEGFEVLRLEPPHVLVLGGLFDPEADTQRPFAAERPTRYWHVTWAFVLEALDRTRTRLHVRVRIAFPGSHPLHVAWMRFLHGFMEHAQLRRLAARAEKRLPRDSFRDVAEGWVGALGMLVDLATPFLRPVRSHWGLDAAAAGRVLPGDELVPDPRWGWTHAVEIDAPPEAVWPWVAQIGADRAGFYSYQWLENVAGCGLVNAETVHPEWEVRKGDSLALHPGTPPLEVVHVEPGRCFVAYGAPDASSRAAGRPWVAASWLFLVEPIEGGRSRFVSRFRLASSDDLATRFANGVYLTESIGFVMDRRMLLGVKERVERRAREALVR